jgi:hypothetical protein
VRQYPAGREVSAQSDQREHGQRRPQPFDASLCVDVQRRRRQLRRGARLGQRDMQVGVGLERDPGRELHVRLAADLRVPNGELASDRLTMRGTMCSRTLIS